MTPNANSAPTTASAAPPVKTGSTKAGRPSLAVARVRRSGGVSARTARPASRPNATAALAMATPERAGRTSTARSARARWALTVVQAKAPRTSSGTKAAAAARLPMARTRMAATTLWGEGAAGGEATRPASPAASPTAMATGAIRPRSAR